MNLLTKENIAIKVSEEYNLTKAESRRIVDFIFDDIANTLEKHGEVSIYNFGKFKVRHRLERKGFNPAAKEKMTIEASDVPVFEPGKRLRELVDRKGH